MPSLESGRFRGATATAMYGSAGENKIRVPKTAELVAARIRKSIVTGALKTGDNLPAEASLIAEFQVSRPTIREAIRILEFEGLISVLRGARGGAKISQPTSAQVSRAAGVALQTIGATVGDVYEARLLIEPPAARLAAQRRPKAAAKRLREHLAHEYTLIGDSGKVSQAIAEFHRLLLEECGNRTMAVMAHALQGVFESHLTTAQSVRAPEQEAQRLRRLRFGLKSHQKLIDLIEAGDGDGAAAHWVAHMEAAGKVWLSDMERLSVIDILD